MERQKFEESWKEAFEGAEATPSEKVWMNIALDLEKEESGKAKRRLLFYKMLAAASVVFGMCIGGVGIYVLDNQHDNSGNVAENRLPGKTGTENKNADSEQTLSAIPESQTSVVPGENTTAEEGLIQTERNNISSPSLSYADKRGSNNSEAHNGRESIDQHNASSKDHFQNNQDVTGNVSTAGTLTGDPESNSAGTVLASNPEREIIYKKRQLPALVKQKNIVPHFPKREPSEFDLMVAKWEQETKEEEKRESSREKLWTSVAVSAGAFNPVGAGATSMNAFADAASFASADNSLKNETEASGLVYSAGVHVGGSISDRWVIQGGINYFTQSSEYVSNVVVEDPSGNYFALSSSATERVGKYYTTAPHNVNNSIRFVSLPVQAGYRLVNRAFGLQLNGGISTDLFIQNTVTPQGGSLEKVTNGRGDDSPYRPLNFSGLFSTEFSYRFSDNYRLAVNPGIRYPFNSIYKSELGLNSTPFTFDVGLKFHYIFE